MRGKKKKVYDNSKIYKVKYTINLMPMLGAYITNDYNPYTKKTTSTVSNEDVNILSMCAESD